jgi:probable F420-dependent oxidoreductase
MKTTIMLPFDNIAAGEEFCGPDAVAEIARRVDASAFYACGVTDHPCPTGRWLDAGGHYAQDPFVMLSLVAAHTRRVRLQTAVLVIPYRNPFITVRAVNALDYNSGGRVILGMGAGYLKGEYRALGVDFDARNDLADEYLGAMKAAWGEDEFSFEGTGYSARGNRILPRPAQQPHPPLWLGGNSKRAIRRAVDYGDAWLPFYTPPNSQVAATARTATLAGNEDLAAGILYMKEYAEKVGKPVPAISVEGLGPSTPDWHPQAEIDRIGALADMGVTCVGASVPGDSRAQWCANMERYSEEVSAVVAD